MLTIKPIPELAGPLYGKEPWPLRFHTHSFSAKSLNTLASAIVYNNFMFGKRKAGIYGEPVDSPSGPPPEGIDWKKFWKAGHSIITDDGQTFPGPVEMEWISLDGVAHRTSLALEEIFPDRQIHHRVARSEVKDAWLETLSFHPVKPEILLELNDRTVRVYMRAMIVSNIETRPGDPLSCLRNELVEVWAQSY
ncbi:hypothetical protein L2Y96_18875 [Luteibacter aegosomaticola]|uniref:hypothetical protein n=1 Tax=Luteibacter aegosomaticola TaxID=2911538 RepID=UPI001FF92DF4|nr:hypothetical protein [Luteibacter aegosomaticola]UPG89435.1 hypothetical protein L2Y96_18875 [Luteibacter aegosomaticola]